MLARPQQSMTPSPLESRHEEALMFPPGSTGSTQRRAMRWPGGALWQRGAGMLLAAAVILSIASPSFADQAPAPDPAGIATGDRTSTTDAAGNSFVVAAPTDPSAPDYAQKKKDYDDYQTQLAKEPLAGKLADHVGHLRVATNFSWTLLTGYLVLFMQAGFALLTCGLVRKKNAGHLMMLNFAAYVFAFLAYYAVGYAFQFGAVAVNAAPVNLGGTPTLASPGIISSAGMMRRYATVASIRPCYASPARIGDAPRSSRTIPPSGRGHDARAGARAASSPRPGEALPQPRRALAVALVPCAAPRSLRPGAACG